MPAGRPHLRPGEGGEVGAPGVHIQAPGQLRLQQRCLLLAPQAGVLLPQPVPCKQVRLAICLLFCTQPQLCSLDACIA